MADRNTGKTLLFHDLSEVFSVYDHISSMNEICAVRSVSPSPEDHGEASFIDKKRSISDADPAMCKKMKLEPEPFPTRPLIVNIVKKSRQYMNHSYRDFSHFPKDDGLPTKIEEMSFPLKLHHLLNEEDIEKAITWMPHGRAFLVVSPKTLEASKLLEKYFGNNRYSSLLRQLLNHGFKHISQGKDRNCHYHEMMLRGMPHLTKYMPAPKNARRLIPDPENEPDFYKLSLQYPLSDQKSTVEAEKPIVPTPAVLQGTVEDSSNKKAASFQIPYVFPPIAEAFSPPIQSQTTTTLALLQTMRSNNNYLLQQLAVSAPSAGALNVMALKYAMMAGEPQQKNKDQAFFKF